jgi:hypothetical protein
MDKLVEYTSPPDSTPDDATQGTYRHKIKDWQLSCTLRGVAYKVVISPWSANDMVMGQCGGGDPDVELTVLRDERVLVRNLQLGGSCSIGPNDPVYVGVLKLSEPQKIAALDDIHIPYSDMPTLDQRKFADPNRKSISPSGVNEQAATACQSENGEFTPAGPSAGGRIFGPVGSHVHLYRRHPALCGSADAVTCEGKAYLVPEDVVDVGKTCGDYVRVRYTGKASLSIGWVEKKSIGTNANSAVGAAAESEFYVGSWSAGGEAAMSTIGDMRITPTYITWSGSRSSPSCRTTYTVIERTTGTTKYPDEPWPFSDVPNSFLYETVKIHLGETACLEGTAYMRLVKRADTPDHLDLVPYDSSNKPAGWFNFGRK